jgi:hypothetical protein
LAQNSKLPEKFKVPYRYTELILREPATKFMSKNKLSELISSSWILLILLVLLPFSASGATYYIDFTAGSDSNSGTSKSLPWKRYPYMRGFTGSYTHRVDGKADRFIFRGGVVWPNENFTMTIKYGGQPGDPDYLGVDKSWGVGSTWTRPIFDAQGRELPGGFDVMILFQNAPSYVVIDEIEMTGLYWVGPKPYNWVSYINIGASTNITIQNSYFRGWSHGTTAQGTTDALNVILGDSQPPYNIGTVIDRCLFDGGPNADSGEAVKYVYSVMKNCTIRNMTNGLIGGHIVVGNDISNIKYSFDPNAHGNSIELWGGINVIANNIVHDSAYGEPYLDGGGGTGTTTFIFNNVFYGQSIQKGALGFITTMGRGETVYAFNNTLVPQGSMSGLNFNARYPGDSYPKVVIQNNLVLTDGSLYTSSLPINSLTVDHNVMLKHDAALSLGYSSATQYRPPNSALTSIGSPTSPIAAGVDASAIVALIPDTVVGYPMAETKALMLKGINGVQRPTGSPWDAGAYQLGAGGGTATPSAPLRLRTMP